MSLFFFFVELKKIQVYKSYIYVCVCVCVCVCKDQISGSVQDEWT